MVSTDLGACEWFLWDLRRSNLLDRGQLDQIVGAFLEKNPRAEPPALAEFLVGQGILTQFQADRLLQGKTQGFVLGPYVLMDSLGTGSMGTVYRAQSKTDGKWFAVKVLPRRSMWNVRLARRKVRVFEQHQHPSIVPFVDVGTSGGMHYLAWPMVEGTTLEKIVQTEGKLDPGRVARLAVQAVEGLEVFHQQGLFHGLLKPSNFMISLGDHLYVLDFGIGSLLAETEGESLVDTMSTANSVSSGLDCASPESIMDPTNLNPVGDQYSLGCVLYYCLTGQYPFPEGTAAEKMIAQQIKEPAPLLELAPEVPEGLALVVERLMQKSPATRFSSTGQLLEALRPFANEDAAAFRAHVQPERKPEPPRQRAVAGSPAAAPRPLIRPEAHGAARPKPAAAPSHSPRQSPNGASAHPQHQRHPQHQNGSASATQSQPSPQPAAKATPRMASPLPSRELFEDPPRRKWVQVVSMAALVVVTVGISALAWYLSRRFF